MRESTSKSRRRGEVQSVPIEAILEDHEDVDGRTREWLVSYEASNVKYGKSASVNSQGVNVFKSVVSSFARMSDAGGPYLSVDRDALNSWSFDVCTTTVCVFLNQ